MDPRTQRSRDRLTAAVLRLAGRGRLDDVSVSELAKAAEVTRDTFYRHASSVPDLLTMAIGQKLDEVAAPYVAILPARADLPDALRRGERDVLQHIIDHADLYRTALSSRSAASVRWVLTAFFQQQFALALAMYPDVAPVRPEELDELTLAMLSAYAASGSVGAIEIWLHSDDVSDVDRATEIIQMSAPRWWSELLDGVIDKDAERLQNAR